MELTAPRIKIMEKYPKFGKNWATMTALTYDEARKFIKITYHVEGKDLYLFLQKASDKLSKELQDKFNRDTKQTLVHIMRPYCKEFSELAKEAQPKSIKDWYDLMLTNLPPDFASVELDLFLQWQRRPRDGQTKTWLEVPNTSNGYFVCLRTKGYTRVIDEDGLRYVNGDAEHLFKRTRWFMDSTYAKRQGVEVVEKPEEKPATEPAEKANDDDLPF